MAPIFNKIHCGDKWSHNRTVRSKGLPYRVDRCKSVHRYYETQSQLNAPNPNLVLVVIPNLIMIFMKYDAGWG